MNVRPARAEDAVALGVVTVSASLGTFLGRIPEDRLDLGWRPEDSAAGWQSVLSELPSEQALLVAELEGRVAGFVWAGCSGSEGQSEGEIKGLYVLPTRQRQGIGRLLVGEAVNWLRRQHRISSLLIGCVAENPSCGFYRHFGGVEAFRRPRAVDRHPTEEIFFRWDDLSLLT